MFSIHHISLSVKDIDDSVEFYKRLGFKKVSQWNSENNSLTIVHMSLNDYFLEFFYFTENQEAPESMKSLETDLPRVGIKHFGLKVDSIERAKEFVLSHNLSDAVSINKGRTGIDYFL